MTKVHPDHQAEHNRIWKSYDGKSIRTTGNFREFMNDEHTQLNVPIRITYRYNGEHRAERFDLYVGDVLVDAHSVIDALYIQLSATKGWTSWS